MINQLPQYRKGQIRTPCALLYLTILQEEKDYFILNLQLKEIKEKDEKDYLIIHPFVDDVCDLRTEKTCDYDS